jgi:rhamnogalacturonyl hydrolase YesR
MVKNLRILMLLLIAVSTGCQEKNNTAEKKNSLAEANTRQTAPRRVESKARQIENLDINLNPADVRAIMEKVADWQIANPSEHHPADWTQGAYYAGLVEMAKISRSKKYYKELLDIGNKNEWKLHTRTYVADDHCVGQMYLEMYRKFCKPEMLEHTKRQFDFILLHKPTTNLKVGSPYCTDRWCWCDALFMAPPVWAKLAAITERHEYLEYMNKQWWATTNYLLDKEENLYYRDSNYFNKCENNGEKVFWSRGNGWVYAGLARVIEELPEKYKHRKKYIKLFKKMSAKIIQIQPESGLWHASLLDPESYPQIETSGSGFFCFGLAYGINTGILDPQKYLPPTLKAWQALTECVHNDGMLGYVQPTGEAPKTVTADMTEVYGTGAFLLAGSQIYNLALRQK